jgi:hypothetical protein
MDGGNPGHVESKTAGAKQQGESPIGTTEVVHNERDEQEDGDRRKEDRPTEAVARVPFFVWLESDHPSQPGTGSSVGVSKPDSTAHEDEEEQCGRYDQDRCPEVMRHGCDSTARSRRYVSRNVTRGADILRPVKEPVLVDSRNALLRR